MSDIVAALSKTNIFSGLPPAYLHRIARIGGEEPRKHGDTIFAEGDKGDKFYLILEGAVRISRLVPGMGEEALAILRPGDYFGEMSIIDGRPRSATVTALEDLTTLAITAWDFEGLMEQHPSMMRALLVELSGRIRLIEHTRS